MMTLPTLQKMLTAFPESHLKHNGYYEHADNPRFDFRVKEDGSIFIKPWTHHTVDQILAMGGMNRPDVSPNGHTYTGPTKDTLDLLDLAIAKGIDPRFLESFGLQNGYRYKGRHYVKIAYFNADGTQHTKVRIRKAIEGKYKQIWDEDTPGEIIPYGLHKLDLGLTRDYLLIGEGESDAWACWYHDVPYLGIPGSGMQGTLKHLDLSLLPPKIYILQEPDQVERFNESFYKSTHKALRANGYKGEIFYIDFKKATEHKDPSELHIALRKEGLASQFSDRIRQALHNAIPANDGQTTYNLTDLGNAERFAEKYRDKVRWCGIWNTWMVFDGKAWEPDRTGYVDYLAKVVVRGIYNEAAAEPDDAKRKQLVKHAAASESNRSVRAMLDRAKSELPVIPAEFNKHLYLINCNNGTLDLRIGELRDHSPHDMLTRCLKADYDPLAVCPLWEDFIQGIFDQDAALIQFMKEALGMSLCGDTSEQCLFICHGSGSNGKTTMLETVRIIMEDYGLAANIETFSMRKHQGIGNDVAELYGARLVTASENTLGSRLNEAFIKKATGKEPLRARRLHENEFQFMPEFSIWFAVNHKPVVKDTSKGMWRRVHFIPFSVTIEGDKIDKHLGEKLLSESEGILAWLVQGHIDWHTRGHLEAPKVVEDATKAYKTEMDTIARFLAQECVFDNHAKIPCAQLKKLYETWCDLKGEEANIKDLTSYLNDKGFKGERGAKGVHYYHGIGLAPIPPDGMGDVGDVGDVKSNNFSRSEETNQNTLDFTSPDVTHVTSELEFEETDESHVTPSDSVRPKPPNRGCLHCDARDWQWDDLLDRYTCGGCNHG